MVEMLEKMKVEQLVVEKVVWTAGRTADLLADQRAVPKVALTVVDLVEM